MILIECFLVGRLFGSDRRAPNAVSPAHIISVVMPIDRRLPANIIGHKKAVSNCFDTAFLKRCEDFLTARQQAKLARDLLLLPDELLGIGISVRGCLHKSQ